MKTYSNLRGVLSPRRKNNHITSKNFPQFLEKNCNFVENSGFRESIWFGGGGRRGKDKAEI